MSNKCPLLGTAIEVMLTPSWPSPGYSNIVLHTYMALYLEVLLVFVLVEGLPNTTSRPVYQFYLWPYSSGQAKQMAAHPGTTVGAAASEPGVIKYAS